MKLKWPQIFGVSLSLELGKAATDLKPCTQCGHWPMLGMSIPCASKYRFRPDVGCTHPSSASAPHTPQVLQWQLRMKLDNLILILKQPHVCGGD